MTAPAPAAWVLLLAFMGLLNSFGSDMLVPALPALREDLGIGTWQAQQAISLFFIASAFMSLWYGAIADACGRRTTILCSLLVLSLAAAASIFVDGAAQLWGLRLVQGMAAGAGMVVSRSILSDLRTDVGVPHLLSRITMIQTFSLIAAPLFGAWLSAHYGWRAVFMAMSAIALTLAGLYWRWLPETLPRDGRLPLRPLDLGRAYRTVLSQPRFLRLSLAHVANWTSMAVYAVAAPVIVTQLLGRQTTEIYLVYGPLTLGLALGFLAFPRLLAAWRSKGVLAAAYVILGLSVALSLAVSWQWPASPTALLPIFTYTFGMALALPLLLSGAVEPLRQSAGVAASCQTFMQFAMVAVAGGLLAPLLWDSLFALAAGTGALTLAGGFGVLFEHLAARRQVPLPNLLSSPQQTS